MEASIQFLKYEVDKLKLDKTSSEKNDNKFVANYSISDDNQFGKVQLFTNIINENINLEVHLTGYFRFIDDNSSVEKEELLAYNGTAILFPYLRMIISNVTLNCLNQPIIIPTINVQKLLNEKK